MARLMRTEKKTWRWSLRNASETSDLGLENLESWRKFKIIRQIWRNTAATGLCISDLEQHRCSNRTVYGSFRSEGSRCGGTPLLRDDCVRVNSFGTGSQHIPDLEQHPYHMLVNSFVRFDNPDLSNTAATALCTGQLFSSCITTIFVFFLRCLHPSALGIAFI